MFEFDKFTSALKSNSFLHLCVLMSVIVFSGLVDLPLIYFKDGLHILLPDDVMITVRAAQMFSLTGAPVFNQTDVAQAASSFALPIIYGILLKFINYDISLFLFCVAGAFFYLLALDHAILKDKESRSFVSLVALFSTSTLTYLFSGWEHLYQCFLLIVVTKYFFLDGRSLVQNLCLGSAAALSILMRADSVFIVAPVLLYLLVKERSKGSLVTYLSFGIIGIGYTYYQLMWFGRLLPTTFRLKAGASLPIIDSIGYLIKNCFNGSSLSLVLIMLIYFFIHRKKLSEKYIVLIFGVCVTFIYCVKVTDVFPGTRMMMPALIIVIFLYNRLKVSANNYFRLAMILSLIFGLGIRTFSSLKSSLYLRNPPEIEQLMLSKYIKDKIKPSFGSIGYCYLGVASGYIDYEAADFLGKADEDIASSNIKWGPTGHNKWDAQKTIRKWNPALVFMSKQRTQMSPYERLQNIEKRMNFAFWSDICNELEEQNYTFILPEPEFDYGFYVRHDLLHLFRD